MCGELRPDDNMRQRAASRNGACRDARTGVHCVATRPAQCRERRRAPPPISGTVWVKVCALAWLCARWMYTMRQLHTTCNKPQLHATCNIPQFSQHTTSYPPVEPALARGGELDAAAFARISCFCRPAPGPDVQDRATSCTECCGCCCCCCCVLRALHHSRWHAAAHVCCAQARGWEPSTTCVWPAGSFRRERP